MPGDRYSGLKLTFFVLHSLSPYGYNKMLQASWLLSKKEEGREQEPGRILPVVLHLCLTVLNLSLAIYISPKEIRKANI